jgi:putative oxidoreductase
MNWAGQPVREGFEFHILAIGLVVAIMVLGDGKWSIDPTLTKN